MNRRRGFSLVELLVAVAVFAVMAALAYGGLNAIAKTRAELARQEDQFRDLTRAVTALNRDLSEATSRSVRGASGQLLPAFLGAADHVEFSRLGFANPQAEQRSNLERVFYELDGSQLKRGRYAVLDRANDTQPLLSDLHLKLDAFRLTYLDSTGRWLDAWPQQGADITQLPRAVQWTLRSSDYGELQSAVELVATWPPQAATNGIPSGTGTTTPVTPTPGSIP